LPGYAFRAFVFRVFEIPLREAGAPARVEALPLLFTHLLRRVRVVNQVSVPVLAKTLRLVDVKASDCDAVFYPRGHG
jgi:hypothetical protein